MVFKYSLSIMCVASEYGRETEKYHISLERSVFNFFPLLCCFKSSSDAAVILMVFRSVNRAIKECIKLRLLNKKLKDVYASPAYVNSNRLSSSDNALSVLLIVMWMIRKLTFPLNIFKMSLYDWLNFIRHRWHLFSFLIPLASSLTLRRRCLTVGRKV